MPDPDDVALTDLDVIQRFSLAVRSARAPRADVIAALRSDLAWLEGADEPAEPPKPAPRKRPVKKATAS